MTLNSKELRQISFDEAEKIAKKIKRKEIYFILENVLDTYNIGGFFRLADAVGAKKIYLCGSTATPPDTKIRKASVGTYKFIDWDYKLTTKEAIKDVKKIKGMKLVAIEQSNKSVDYRKISYCTPLTFVLGNETSGLEKKTEKLVDEIAEVPMYGINKSLNVMIAAGVVVFSALNKMKTVKR